MIFAVLPLAGCSQNTDLNKNNNSNTKQSLNKSFNETREKEDDRKNAIIYYPKGYSSNHAYPIILVFRHDGDAKASIMFWKELADKHQFIVWASKEYRNYMKHNDLETLIRNIQSIVRSLSMNPSIKKEKIFLTGLSGGGIFSEVTLLDDPSLIKGIIVNTGSFEVWSYYRDKTKKDFNLIRNKFFSKKPLIIMLASPTDFRYQEMKRDRIIFQELGATVKWIEFKGGHTFAPKEIYSQVLKELL